jgi:ribosomal protein S18 acetylase RimI-like enzyme
MKRSFLVRKARPGDFDALCALYQEIDEHHREARPDLFRVPVGERRERSAVAALIEGDDSTILVAEDGSLLLGFVTMIVKTVPANIVRDERRFAEIDNLVVRAGARRQGIAHALVDAGAAWASARAIETLELSVYAFNIGALAFYRSEGFDPLVVRMTRPLRGQRHRQ